MQNYYAVERFIQEHDAHARAVAELQALRRKAAADRRRVTWESWRARVGRLFAGHPRGRDLAREGRQG